MIGLFFEWYFLETPAKIKKIWGNYLWYFWCYFAIAQLVREILAPWKGIVFKREKRGFDLGDTLSAALSNFIFRIIAAIVRLIFIVAGVAFESVVLAAGVVAFTVWLVLIPATCYFFVKGWSLLI